MELGDNVIIKCNNKHGTIIRKNGKDKFLVKLQNNICINATIDELMKDEKETDLKKNQYFNSKVSDNKITYKLNENKYKNNEIMLRHLTLNNAIYELDYFISNALANNIKEIKIIHGRNGGILRKGVHDYLKKCEYVESFRLGDHFEGSLGVTIAKLK